MLYVCIFMYTNGVLFCRDRVILARVIGDFLGPLSNESICVVNLNKSEIANCSMVVVIMLGVDGR